MLGVHGALQTAHSPFHPVTPDVSVCPYHCLVCFQIRSLNGLCQEQSRKLVSSTLYMEFHLFSPKHKLNALCGTTQLLLWKSWLSCGIKMVQR